MEPWLHHSFPALFEGRKGLWYGKPANKRTDCNGCWGVTREHTRDLWYGGVFAHIEEDCFSIIDIASYPKPNLDADYKKFWPTDPNFLADVDSAINEFMVWADLIIPNHHNKWYWVAI